MLSLQGTGAGIVHIPHMQCEEAPAAPNLGLETTRSLCGSLDMALVIKCKLVISNIIAAKRTLRPET